VAGDLDSAVLRGRAAAVLQTSAKLQGMPQYRFHMVYLASGLYTASLAST